MQSYVRQYDNNPSFGLLQPVQAPKEVWVHVLVEGLPKSFGKEVIFLAGDRFSPHFAALGHLVFAVDVAQSYVDHVFKLHAWPQSIISDKDRVFLKWTLASFAIHSRYYFIDVYILEHMGKLRLLIGVWKLI